jgi:hypothetical protein
MAKTEQEKRESNRIAAKKWRDAHPERSREISQKYWEKNKVKLHTKNKKWTSENPEKRREIDKNFYARNRQKRNDSAKEYKRKKLVALAGRERPTICEVCNMESEKTLHFDHNHETGEFRGWICGPCNRAIGIVKENPDTLRALADYLEQSRNQ